MSALCGPNCGYCGRCDAAWEREEDDIEDDGVEVCPDCMGAGEIVRENGSDALVVAECRECEGKGWTA